MRNYRDVVTDFVKDPEEASEYIQASLDEYEKDGNLDAFLTAIRTVAEARGGITQLAHKTNLNRQHLYRSLSKNGNPTIKTLDSILHSLGLKLAITKAE